MALILTLLSRGAGSNVADLNFNAGNLEVLGVTDTSFTLSWSTGSPLYPAADGTLTPVAADSVVRYGTSPDAATWTAVTEPGTTPYHVVEVGGLAPDTTYYFEALSGGVRAVNVSADAPLGSPAWVHTLARPPGAEVARVAVMNDLHYGERVSGILFGDFPPGFPADPANPYWRFAGGAALEQAAADGATAVVANGDLTSENEPDSVAEVKAALDAFALGGRRYHVTRGNHDAADRGPLYAPCPAVPADPVSRDCFAAAFGYGPGEPLNWTADVGPVRLVGIDSNNTLTAAAHLSAESAAFLQTALTTETDRPTLVFLHHPATAEAVNSWPYWPNFNLGAGDLATLGATFAPADQVLAVFSGHTHRAHVSAGARPDVVFHENLSVKEYPSGYSLVTVYEGGMTVAFRPTRCADCNRWRTKSARQYYGLYPGFVRGRLADRAYTVTFDRPVTPDGHLGPPAGPKQRRRAAAGSGTLPAA